MTKSRKEKFRRRILDSLKEKATLSNDRGKFIQSQFTKPNKKVRRHSGRYTPQIHQKGKFSEMIANAEEPKEEYDDWIEYRDGFRDLSHYGSCGHKCEICKAKNERIKRQVARRKLKEEKRKMGSRRIELPTLTV